MAQTTGTRAGTAGMSENENLALSDNTGMIGYVEPLIGRTAWRDVQGYFGFPLIKAGQTVTRAIAERAHSLGRLFELTAATEDV